MKEAIIKILKERGYGVGKKRACIVDAVCEIKIITDVEKFWLDLYHSKGIAWSTIHANLRFLTQEGILVKEIQDKRRIVYTLK